MPKKPPKAYLEMIEQETANQKANRIKANAVRKADRDKEVVLYEKISKALRAYNNVKIEKYQLTIKNYPKKNTVELYVNGGRWMTFFPEWHTSSCGCDGQCNCEYTSWLTLGTIEHHSSSEESDYNSYFGCDEGELADPKKFAYAMKKALESYEFRDPEVLC